MGGIVGGRSENKDSCNTSDLLFVLFQSDDKYSCAESTLHLILHLLCLSQFVSNLFLLSLVNG